jgi:N-acetylglucosamine-6-phosphate deacetylase
LLIVSAHEVLIDGSVAPRALVIEGTRIAAVLDEIPPDGPEHIRLTSGVLTPGMIDLHVNGAMGVDWAEARPQAWMPVLRGMASRGVTSVQPTFITAPLDRLKGAAAVCAEAGRQRPADAARVLGAHLEGPFLNPARKGAHRPDWMLQPTQEHLDALLGGVKPRTVTLAPELPGALAAIARLTSEGIVVSLGHTDASGARIREAADAGATMVTHLFNAQGPLHHRGPGVPGTALADDRLTLALIVDGHHVHPDVCRLAFAAAPGRIAAVTDSILTAGLEPHTPLRFGGLPVANDDTGTGRRPDGTIAGAGIVLDEGVRRMISAGIDPAAVLSACTATPARAIARPDLGILRAGALADLVWWDDDYRPRRVWIDGREVNASDR